MKNIRDRNKIILTIENEIMEGWRQHLEELKENWKQEKQIEKIEGKDRQDAEEPQEVEMITGEEFDW